MKKEVIFYSGFSMVPPESVELLENNKGSIITPSSDAKIVDIQDYKILSFWDRIEEIGVWKWHKKYPYSKLKYEQLLKYDFEYLVTANPGCYLQLEKGRQIHDRNFEIIHFIEIVDGMIRN